MTDGLKPMDRDEAIGYALLETNHLGGFARKGPAFAEKLEQAGWCIVPVADDDEPRDPEVVHRETIEGAEAMGFKVGVKHADESVPATRRVVCYRCHRALQNVFWVGGLPLGRVCVKLVDHALIISQEK